MASSSLIRVCWRLSLYLRRWRHRAFLKVQSSGSFCSLCSLPGRNNDQLLRNKLPTVCRRHTTDTVIDTGSPHCLASLTSRADVVIDRHIRNDLLLNPSKTKALVADTRQQVAKLETSNQSYPACPEFARSRLVFSIIQIVRFKSPSPSALALSTETNNI